MNGGMEEKMDNNDFNQYDSGNYEAVNYSSYNEADQEARINTILSKTFLYMFGVLLLSGLTAYITANSVTMLMFVFASDLRFYGLLISELVIVGITSSAIKKNNVKLSALMLILYSVVNGMTLSVVFLVYAASSIASIFFMTAILFGVVAVFGLVTKKDLTTVGRISMMLLFGLIILSIGHMLFFRGQPMNTAISAIGLAIFIALTAYDTQNIKRYASQNSEYSDHTLAMMGALILYLDFINIFLKLLALFAKKND